jgi:hypothetical protein
VQPHDLRSGYVGSASAARAASDRTTCRLVGDEPDEALPASMEPDLFTRCRKIDALADERRCLDVAPGTETVALHTLS